MCVLSGADGHSSVHAAIRSVQGHVHLIRDLLAILLNLGPAILEPVLVSNVSTLSHVADVGH
jgi:hypothetical protein